MEIRLSDVVPHELNWNKATANEIKRTFADFQDPQVEKIQDLLMQGERVVVWAAHNVDGELLMADTAHRKCKISFEIRTERSQELRDLTPDFLSILKSVRLEPTKDN